MRLVLAAFLVLAAPASAQTFAEDFDSVPNDALPPGWTTFQTGAPPELVWRVGNGLVYSSYVARASGESGLVTPLISPDAGDVLRFEIGLFAASTVTAIEVRASTGSTDASDFDQIVGRIEGPEFPLNGPLPVVPLRLVQFDLAPVAGQTVRLAFVHINTVLDPARTDGVLVFDDVVVGAPPPAGSGFVVLREPEPFGLLPLGFGRQTVAQVENRGGVALTIGEATVGGATDQIAVSRPPAGTVLRVGDVAEISFAYMPTVVGDASVTVTLPSGNGDVHLTASGTAGYRSTFTGTTVGGTRWVIPFALNGTCETTTLQGDFVLLDMHVSVSGQYRLGCLFGNDPYGHPPAGTLSLYPGAFDPQHSCEGAIFAVGPDSYTVGEVGLTAGVPYRLAVSSYRCPGCDPVEPYVGAIIGPGTIAFATAEAPGPDASASSIEVVGANPSHGRVAVSVRAETPGPARVEAFDVLGRRVAILFDGVLGAEARGLRISDVAPGIYTVRLTTRDGAASRRVTVVR